MPTNRPFFTNFLAAFRAHSALQKSTSLSVSPAGTSSQTTHTSTGTPSATSTHSNNPSNPRSINTKTTQQSFGATTAAVQAAGHLQSTRQHSTSPVSRSPMSSNPPTSPHGGMINRSRRGSDSSSEGFRETLGADKWYIGGRSAAGEERYYRLGVVRRHKSVDRLSLDRLSL
ncbi:MAG: hypothetical protein M1835_004660 [Candelina submexicana]|nr:MAG: hypothetical protein M1835_004660 [Candelina submexicana]